MVSSSGSGDGNPTRGNGFDEDSVARIIVEIGDESFEWELAGDPDERPAVMLLDREATLNDTTVEALRLLAGVADAVTQAVLTFRRVGSS